MFALSLLSVVLAWMMGGGSAFVFAFLLHLLHAPIVPRCRGQMVPPSLDAPAWLLQLPFVWGMSSNHGQQVPTLRVEGLQAKPSPGKGSGGWGEAALLPGWFYLRTALHISFISANMK